MAEPELRDQLQQAWRNAGFPGDVSRLKRLTGGANKETWHFTTVLDDAQRELILRRNTDSQQAMDDVAGIEQPSLQVEAQLIHCLRDQGLKLPSIVAVFGAQSPLGEAFVMSCESGEALPKKILIDADFTAARSQLSVDCGQQLATLHSLQIPDEISQNLPSKDLDGRLDRLEQMSQQLGNTSAVHALAMQWLRMNQPDQSRRCLVHGDFRLGNLLVDEHGLSSILDWELARISCPEEDLGYLSANVWRFAQPHNPVGGFGQYQVLLDSYEQEAGWRPSMHAILYWQLMTAVSWGAICLTMQHIYTSGADTSLERLAVGRRFSESEIDILLLLEELA